VGRPSRYQSEVEPHLDEIRKAVESGATDQEVATAFNMSLSTIYEYKRKYPKFKQAFTRGRARVVFDIKAALLKKALGFEYEEEKRVGRKDKDGENIILVEKYKRYSVPSETAAAMLLRNYDENWRDNDKASAELRKQEAGLRKAIAEANNFDLNLDD
jgi:hypothetical protein